MRGPSRLLILMMAIQVQSISINALPTAFDIDPDDGQLGPEHLHRFKSLKSWSAVHLSTMSMNILHTVWIVHWHMKWAQLLHPTAWNPFEGWPSLLLNTDIRTTPTNIVGPRIHLLVLYVAGSFLTLTYDSVAGSQWFIPFKYDYDYDLMAGYILRVAIHSARPSPSSVISCINHSSHRLL